MVKSKYNFPVMFQKLDEVNVSDDRFTKVRIWFMHLDENFNGSIFDKNVVNEAIPTLQYIPIVGFIEKNKSGEDDFSDHRYKITRKDGELTRVYIGNAYGCILSSEDNNAHYEERLCDDGITRTFLVADGIIWNQFDNSSEIMNRDIVKSHSMELWEPSVEGYEDDDYIFHFTKMSFRAACILGDDQEPGMQNSTIEVQFTLTDFIKNIQSELSNKLNTFTEYVKTNNDKINEGGLLMAKPDKTDFSMTAMEQYKEISNMVSAHAKVRDYWGDEVSQYSLVDLQDNEVIVIDRADNYNFYSFSFILDGDKPVIDYTTKKRKKTQYVDYEEGNSFEGVFSFGKQLEDFEKAVTEKIELLTTEKVEAETNFTTIKSELDEIKPKYNEYLRNEEKKIALENEEKKTALFQKFDEHLLELTDYISLKEKKGDLSLSDIESACALMFTEKNLALNFTKKSKSNSAMVADIPEPIADENVVETKYGFIKVSR